MPIALNWLIPQKKCVRYQKIALGLKFILGFEFLRKCQQTADLWPFFMFLHFGQKIIVCTLEIQL